MGSGTKIPYHTTFDSLSSLLFDTEHYISHIIFQLSTVIISYNTEISPGNGSWAVGPTHHISYYDHIFFINYYHDHIIQNITYIISYYYYQLELYQKILPGNGSWAMGLFQTTARLFAKLGVSASDEA